METQDSSQQIIANAGKSSTEAHSRIAEALCSVSVCVRIVGLYGRSHPLVEDTVASAHQALAELLVIQPTVVVAATESNLALDSFPIDDASGALSAFAKSLRERNVSELKLTAGVTDADITNFAEILSLSPSDLSLRGGLPLELQKRKVAHISTREGVLPAESRHGQDPADIYEEALLLVEEAMRAVRAGLGIPVIEMRAIVADSLHSLIGDESALLALAGIRSYDRYLSEHSTNVCILSMVLARDMGLDASSILELGIAAMLHDVGKVFVSTDIVCKSGKLTEQEWQQIRRHPSEGARALAGLPDLPALASTIALEHHIRRDGTGYPAIPANHTPHLLSRLVAIVDTYDALTTDRPYRERWTPQQAIGWMLYEAVGQYDRELMARFASRARLYPIGSLVKLVNGNLAVVASGSYKHPARPILKVVVGRTGADLPIIDLAQNSDPTLEIASMAEPVEAILPYTDRLAA